MLLLYYSRLGENQHPAKISKPEMELFTLKITYQSAKLSQLPEIMVIEQTGFSPAEAATEAAMEDRIKLYPDTFIVANAKDKVAGYIVGPAYHQRYLADDLFETSHPNISTDEYQTVLSLVVHPVFQGLGIGGKLLDELAMVAKGQGRKAVTLTCLKELIPFYERHGYVNEGVSASDHAGETWYNMVRELRP